KQWSLDNGINGLYVYALESTDPLLLQARAFNPKTGQNEDAATGVAAAALSLVFKKNLIIKQGHFIGKSSQLMITYHHPEEIYVGGRIVESNESV
ncbi:MAG: PhzF family phenazine biosynthesis protein, partial [Proteobacteria bacterium]|nr:PhzF family phenazine biosynthesis protein [Pseudomonadota bacterium]